MTLEDEATDVNAQRPLSHHVSISGYIRIENIFDTSRGYLTPRIHPTFLAPGPIYRSTPCVLLPCSPSRDIPSTFTVLQDATSLLSTMGLRQPNLYDDVTYEATNFITKTSLHS